MATTNYFATTPDYSVNSPTRRKFDRTLPAPGGLGVPGQWPAPMPMIDQAVPQVDLSGLPESVPSGDFPPVWMRGRPGDLGPHNTVEPPRAPGELSTVHGPLPMRQASMSYAPTWRPPTTPGAGGGDMSFGGLMRMGIQKAMADEAAGTAAWQQRQGDVAAQMALQRAAMAQSMFDPRHQAMEMLKTLGPYAGFAVQGTPTELAYRDALRRSGFGGAATGPNPAGAASVQTPTGEPGVDQRPEAGFWRTAAHAGLPALGGVVGATGAGLLGIESGPGALAAAAAGGALGYKGGEAAMNYLDPEYASMKPDTMGSLAGWAGALAPAGRLRNAFKRGGGGGGGGVAAAGAAGAAEAPAPTASAPAQSAAQPQIRIPPQSTPAPAPAAAPTLAAAPRPIGAAMSGGFGQTATAPKAAASPRNVQAQAVTPQAPGVGASGQPSTPQVQSNLPGMPASPTPQRNPPSGPQQRPGDQIEYSPWETGGGMPAAGNPRDVIEPPIAYAPWETGGSTGPVPEAPAIPLVQMTVEQMQRMLAGRAAPQFRPPYQGTLDPMRRYLQGKYGSQSPAQ